MTSRPVPPSHHRFYKHVEPASGEFLELISHLISGYFDPNVDDVRSYSFVPDIVSGADAVIRLCKQAKALLEKEPVVTDIAVPPGEQLVLVGDIHGQFNDLLHSVLSVQLKNVAESQEEEEHVADTGGRSVEPKFLFLGDYVDRGPCSLEVITLLLALKVEYPHHIFLLRGNHEEAQTCRMYGFLQECRNKIPVAAHVENEEIVDKNPSSSTPGGANFGRHRFRDQQREARLSTSEGPPNVANPFLQFNAVFCWLPLAAVVQTGAGSIFATHGGLSPHTLSIDSLQFLQRWLYGSQPVMTQCHSGCSVDVDGLQVSEQSNIIEGLLWSDPSEEHSGCRTNARGCGFSFGEDITRQFLEVNNGYGGGEAVQPLQFGESAAAASSNLHDVTNTDSAAAFSSVEERSRQPSGCQTSTSEDGMTTSPSSMHYIVRAHQCVADGFLWSHNHQLLTIFSAPNYCGINDNKGAFGVLDGTKQIGKTRVELELGVYDYYSPASPVMPAKPCLPVEMRDDG